MATSSRTSKICVAGPFFVIEWIWNWLAYWLSGWVFLEVLEYLGTLSLLLAVVYYFAESGGQD